MNARAQEMVLAWQRSVDARWQQQAGLLASHTNAPLPGPPPGLAPRQLAEWWRALSDVDKRRYVDERPDLVAGLDGLPADVRDDANRILLDRAITDLERQEADAWRIPGEGAPQYALGLWERREQLVALRDRLGANTAYDPATGTPAQPYYLLGFDNAGGGQAIVARGNPDTAANVATFVPGTGSDIAHMDLLLDQSNSMHDSANRLGDTNTSVIMWLGYDAPDTVVNAVPESYAVEANESLDRFQQGLDTVNPEAHHTLVGHSYGSLVVGHAARDGGLPVDDILTIASPGMGVDNAGQLNIPPERVWVLEDNQDPIADLGQTGWHGADPGDDAFGANQLRAEPEGRHPTSPSEVRVEEINASHLDYFWNQPSSRQAYENIGDIIAGRPPSHR